MLPVKSVSAGLAAIEYTNTFFAGINEFSQQTANCNLM